MNENLDRIVPLTIENYSPSMFHWLVATGTIDSRQSWKSRTPPIDVVGGRDAYREHGSLTTTCAAIIFKGFVEVGYRNIKHFTTQRFLLNDTKWLEAQTGRTLVLVDHIRHNHATMGTESGVQSQMGTHKEAIR